MPKKNGRISERDLILPTLQILGGRPDGFMLTADLIRELTQHFQPEGEDAEILDGRQDTKFSQIVRNMVSHKDVPTNLIGMGYAEYREKGLRITEAGRKYAKAKSP